MSINSAFLRFSLFFLVFAPVFISLDFSNGIKFDSYLKSNEYAYPSIPISLLLLFVLSLVNVKSLVKSKIIFFYTSTFLVIAVINYFYGVTRALISGFGVLIPVCSYYIFKYKIKIDFDFDAVFNAVFYVILIKFISDVSWKLWLLWVVPEYSIGEGLPAALSTHYFISPELVIYNYNDYFSFIYFVAVTLSLHNFFNKRVIYKSIVLIVISYVFVHATGSRLFIYSMYIIPFLLLFYRFTRLSLAQYFILFFIPVCIITILLGVKIHDFSDVSIAARNYITNTYFSGFSPSHLLFPFNHPYRIAHNGGSFHNEILELFSFFSVFIMFFLFGMFQVVKRVNSEYFVIGYLLMFVLISGAVIQINITNPYIGIITGLLFALITTSQDKDKIISDSTIARDIK